MVLKTKVGQTLKTSSRKPSKEETSGGVSPQTANLTSHRVPTPTLYSLVYNTFIS